MKKVKFSGYIKDKNLSYTFEDTEGEKYYLDQDVCDVSGVNPAFHDQVGNLDYVKVKSKLIDGLSYIYLVSWN